MNRRRNILIAALVLIVAAGGAWYWASPWWTVRSMKQAAEARDVDALSRNVDYPAVREGLKRQFRARSGGDGGVLGALIAGGVADRVVDLALTPEGMRAIFAAAPVARTPRPGAVKLNANEMVMRRDGLTQFRMVQQGGKGGALVFRLRGATWMLSDVELPADGAS
jgi:hypothetical protein